MSTDTTRCAWCGKVRKSMSRWEQKNLSGEWQRLCTRCATRRLRNPFNALLQMGEVAAVVSPREGTENA